MGDERNIFLSTVLATRRDRVAALVVVAISALLFACALPFATVPLAPIPAFIASYQSALAINDLITAVLLFSQFALCGRGLCCCSQVVICSLQSQRSSMP